MEPLTTKDAPMPEPKPAPGGEPRSAPLTYHQERLWFIDEFERDRVYEGSPTYHNIPVLLRIGQSVDAPALEAALNSLVARHEALRTKIQQGRQRVWVSRRFELTVAGVPVLDDEALIAIALQDNRRPFLLERDFLFRATLYRMPEAGGLLALTIHHLVADVHSTRILIEDLIELYRARASGAHAAMPAAPQGFAAYAEWQRALPGVAFDQWVPFWKWQLQGGLMPLELPYVQERHRIHIYDSATRRFTIERDLATALELVASREQASLSDLMLAGFVAVLHACSRQKEIVTGVSHPNRGPGLEHMVGPLANLLVLRFRVDEAKPFGELLRQVQRTVRQAAANRAVPFDLLVQQINPPKDMSRTALFDVLYQFLDPEPHTWSVPNGTISRVDAFIGFGKYDLNLTMRPADAGVSGYLEYNRKLFHEDFIQDLVTLFQAVLRSAAENFNATVAHHVRLPAPLVERQTALLRAEPGVRPRHMTVDAAFDAVACRCPDRIAIVCEGNHLSYRAIADGSRRVSRALVRAGVRPGAPVAVFLDRSPGVIAAILGILRVGAAYVPIDPAYPPLRIKMLIEDSESAFVITSAALTGTLQDHLGKRALRVIDLESCALLSAAPMGSRSLPGDVAYSIYTSGSTGRPKGCLVQHRNVVQLMLSQAAAFAFTERDVWTWSHSLCFDFSVWEIFGALLYGGRGVLLSEDAVRDPAMVERELAREQVTVLSQTPAAGVRLAEQLLDSTAATRSLRWLVFGGDILTPQKLEAWSRRNPRVAIVNMYGITETTVHVTGKFLTDDEIANNSRSVGRALPNAAVYILGDGFELLPMGVLGEIGVTGDGVSLGYWKRPDLTAERFVPDPFSGRLGVRMYLSGDLGRVLPNGEIGFHGRRDNQVKIRGYRVELGEIEKTLADHPGVAEAAVIAKDDCLGNRTLVAFVTPKQADLDPNALRVYLQERLTPGMLPGLIQPAQALPKTASGKVDRRALANLALISEESTRGYVAPRDEHERILAGIWEEVLGRTPIGIADNFFEIGGDSILSIQICARAARSGFSLTPKQLFEHSTIEELSLELSRKKPESATKHSITEAPLLPVQEWFFAQEHAEPNHFNQSAWFALAPGLGAEDLKEAFRILRERHVALRLIFVRRNGHMLQKEAGVLEDDPFTTLSLAGATEEERRREVALAAEQAQRGLDIYRGPLFRALYVEPAADQPGRLLLVFHHLIFDSVSWRTLVEDLDLLLEHGLESRPSMLPKGSSLLEYAADLVTRAGAGDDSADAGPGLPCEDAALLASNTFEHYQEFETSVDEITTRAIADALARDKLNWEEALMAGVAQAMLEGNGGDTQVLSFEGHGRDTLTGRPDISHAIGWFMKLYRISLGRPRGDARDYVREARAEIARAKQGPDLLERWYAHKSELPAPGVCVNYVGQFDALLRSVRRLNLSEGETGRAIGAGNRRSQLIDVNALILRGRLRMRWGYCAAIHRHGAIEQLAAACSRFLRSLAAGAHSQAQPHAEAYPLAPGQLGIFYRALLQPAGLPEYVVRSVLKIGGELDPEIFRRSWAFLLERHAGLRAYFEWDGAEGPVQWFAERATLPVTLHDWRDVEPAMIGTRLEALVLERAQGGFNLAAAPLASLDLVRTGEQEHHALLQIHHLILDGWSLAILRDELLRTYGALCSGASAPSLERAGRFQDYLRFLETQDPSAARLFWKRRLQGVRACALPAAGDQKASVNAIAESHSLDVIKRPLARNRGFARWAASHRLTLNTVVQGLWSLVVGCLTHRSAVVTGVVVAGRPEAIQDVETTIGAFINTLPLIVSLDRSAPLATWLRKIQDEFIDSQRFEHFSLSQICAWAGLPADQPLFDTVLVCENYPARRPQRLYDLTFQEVSYSIKESIPVVLEYSFSKLLVCRLRYRPDLVNGAVVGEAAELLRLGFEELERNQEISVGRLASLLDERAAARRKDRQNQFAVDRGLLLRELTTTRKRTKGGHQR